MSLYYGLKRFFPILPAILLVMLCMVSPAFSATPTGTPAPQTVEQLSEMEQQLFSRNYERETPENRIARLEKTILGSTQGTLGINARIQSLQQFLQPTTPAAPVTSTNRPAATGSTMAPPQAPPVQTTLPGESQYPIVSTMEQRVFRQTFESDTLENRLGRLEQRTLGRPQHGALQERSDQLRMMILGQTTPGGSIPPPEAITLGEPSSAAAGGPSQLASADLLQALPNIERKVLRHTYPQDPPENRISRLEMKLFNATAPEMSLDDRFYRIAGVVMAQRSARQEQMMAGMSGPGIGIGGPYGPGRTFGTSVQTRSSSSSTLGSMLLMILMSMF